jgi:hypothetical protein
VTAGRWPFRTRPTSVPLALPRLDGAGWPDEAALGRPSFETNTFYELAVRHAYEPESHAVADLLVDEALPHVPTGVTAEDEPYLRKVFITASRIGAGVAIVERTLGPVDAGTADRRIAGALWQARRKLPAMQADWSRYAGWFLLAGYHVARTGPSAVERLLAQLRPAGDA